MERLYRIQALFRLVSYEWDVETENWPRYHSINCLSLSIFYILEPHIVESHRGLFPLQAGCWVLLAFFFHLCSSFILVWFALCFMFALEKTLYKIGELSVPTRMENAVHKYIENAKQHWAINETTHTLTQTASINHRLCIQPQTLKLLHFTQKWRLKVEQYSIVICLSEPTIFSGMISLYIMQTASLQISTLVSFYKIVCIFDPVPTR